MIKRLLYTLDRRFSWKRSSHEADAERQSAALKVGDIVECAIETPEKLRYRVEAIDHELKAATIKMIGQLESDETPVYMLSLSMIRPLVSESKK